MSSQDISEAPTSKKYCRRCKCHDIYSTLKGHKAFCDFKNCECSKCSLIPRTSRKTQSQDDEVIFVKTEVPNDKCNEGEYRHFLQEQYTVYIETRTLNETRYRKCFCLNPHSDFPFLPSSSAYFETHLHSLFSVQPSMSLVSNYFYNWMLIILPAILPKKNDTKWDLYFE